MADDRPRIAVIPPLAWLLAGVAGYLLDRFLPLGLLPTRPWMPGIAVGVVLIAVSATFDVAGARAFLKAGTPINPYKASRTLVRSGIYRITRNPMYLGMVGTLAGLGLALSNAWMILAAAALWALLHRGVVLPEERYLRAKFGAPYDEFLRTTRRWL